MVESCKFTVMDNAIVPAPIENVYVAIYDITGVVFISSGTTDVSGELTLALPGPLSYEVRLYKSGGVIFTSPQTIDVLSPPVLLNEWVFTGTVTTSAGVAPDPRYCRVHGVFIDTSGQPMPGIVVTFRQAHEGTVGILGMLDIFDQPHGIVDGKTVVGWGIRRVTDANGRISVDLIRGNTYHVVVGGSQRVGECTIPDRPAVDIIDLIYPYIVSVTFTPAGLALFVGGTATATVVITFSDGRTSSTPRPELLTYTSAAPTIASVSPSSAVLSVQAIAVGSTQVSVSRVVGTYLHRLPEVAISYAPLTISVT